MECIAANTVCLDHHIPTEPIRYRNPDQREHGKPDFKAYSRSLEIRLSDISSEWFLHLRKPDFQKKTDTWFPEQCATYLESLVAGKRIPTVHLIQPQENGKYYVLDGAHRLSVLRAWVSDDWGDRPNNSYDGEADRDAIVTTACDIRALVAEQPGNFLEFERSFAEREALLRRGALPEREMSERQLRQAAFMAEALQGQTLLFAMVTWLVPQYPSIVFENF